MDPRDFFRGFFGFPNARHQHPPFDEDMDQNPRGDNRDTFNVFTNPLDMERFFNQQMEAILKNFGINDGFFSYSGPEDGTTFPLPPPGGFRGQGDSDPGSREFMLKREPGIVPPVVPGVPAEDEEIESIDKESLDKLYSKDDDPSGTVIRPGHPFGGIFVNPFFSPRDPRSFSQDEASPVEPFGGRPSNFFSFGRSVIQTRTVKPDGTIEEERTVRDSSGNETTTVTRISGDQRTTTTIVKNPDGSSKVTDNPPSTNDFPLSVTPPEFGFNPSTLLGILSGLLSENTPLKPKSSREEMLKPVPEHEQATYKSLMKKFFSESW